MIKDTTLLMTVPNTPEGWERISNLRKSLKDTPVAVALYGRHPDRKNVAKRLFELSDGSRAEKWIHLDLRRSVPIPLATSIRVYLKPRPKTRWAETDDGKFMKVPTKWAFDIT
jgi:hypothetical protein